MFPHLYEHLRSGLQQVLSKVTGRDGWERQGKLARADTAAYGIVCEFTDGKEPHSLTITQKDLEEAKLSVECIRVLTEPSTGVRA